MPSNSPEVLIWSPDPFQHRWIPEAAGLERHMRGTASDALKRNTVLVLHVSKAFQRNEDNSLAIEGNSRCKSCSMLKVAGALALTLWF